MNNSSLIIISLAQLNNTKYASVGLIVIGLFGFVTNILIVWTIWKQKVLHNSCFLLIAQLAVADWIVGTSYAATGTKRLIRLYFGIPEVQNQIQCSAEMFLPYFGQNASLILALAIGVERFIAAAFPIQFMIHERRIGSVIAPIAWLYAVIDSCFMFYGISSTMIITSCTIVSAATPAFNSFEDWHKSAMVLLITVTYVLVFLVITVQFRKAKQLKQQNVIAMKKTMQVKTAKMLAVVAVVYLILQMATRIGMASLNSTTPEIRANITPYIRMFMILNSAHLFIYVGFSSEFREAFKEAMKLNRTRITALTGLDSGK